VASHVAVTAGQRVAAEDGLGIGETGLRRSRRRLDGLGLSCGELSVRGNQFGIAGHYWKTKEFHGDLAVDKRSGLFTLQYKVRAMNDLNKALGTSAASAGRCAYDGVSGYGPATLAGRRAGVCSRVDAGGVCAGRRAI